MKNSISIFRPELLKPFLELVKSYTACSIVYKLCDIGVSKILKALTVKIKLPYKAEIAKLLGNIPWNSILDIVFQYEKSEIQNWDSEFLNNNRNNGIPISTQVVGFTILPVSDCNTAYMMGSFNQTIHPEWFIMMRPSMKAKFGLCLKL